ncbi:MAG: hypothetical protein K5771_02600 [Oscillospiraceae bacterium]|nr:hypothetical protein [Oscillospiraceae bacterium]
MAGIYRQFNLSAQIPYRVQFVCEKCGKKNTLSHSVIAGSAYTDRGTLRQKTINARKVKALGQLSKNTSDLITKISDETSRKKYRRIHLTCRCSGCSHLPVWAYPKWFSIVQRISNISFFIAFIIILFNFLNILEGDNNNWRPLVIAAAPGVLCWLGTCLYSIWQSIQIKHLDEKYLPTIVQTGKK